MSTQKTTDKYQLQLYFVWLFNEETTEMTFSSAMCCDATKECSWEWWVIDAYNLDDFQGYYNEWGKINLERPYIVHLIWFSKWKVYEHAE